MVIDSSAIFAIVFDEADHDIFLDAIVDAKTAIIGAPTLLECRIVALRKGSDYWSEKLQAMLDRLSVQVSPFDAHHERIAAAAFRRYGKGINRAGLNFGDCLCYAVAKARNEPLLFKGEDFRLTDIASAL